MNFRRAVSYFLQPIVKWYLRKERSYSYKEIKVAVPPGVFHPGLFSSTTFLLEFILKKSMQGQSVLELGCGSGLISIFCSKAGARVTAVDLNRKAVNATVHNAKENGVSIVTLLSDLFAQLPSQTFDWIIVNPPFYPREPKTEEDLAWYCGEQFEYFHKLFKEAPSFMHQSTNTLMVLSEDCDLAAIKTIASTRGFRLQEVGKKTTVLFEKNFLFLLKDNDATSNHT